MKITFKDLEDIGCSSVTDYCRLLTAEKDYTGVRLEVYRGEMKCLIVNDIQKASELEATGVTFRKHRGSILRCHLQPV